MISRETLKQVITSQREFLDSSEQGTLREENRELKIEDSFALIITGVRRCGKSTFLHQVLKKQKKGYYLNLEDPRIEGFDLSDFNKIEGIMIEIYGEGGIYFFDEIQNVPGWEKFVRYLIDKKEKIVLTGSNASLLSRELGTKLTGRHLQIEMFPFSFREFLYSPRMPNKFQSSLKLTAGYGNLATEKVIFFMPIASVNIGRSMIAESIPSRIGYLRSATISCHILSVFSLTSSMWLLM